ncbi:MAG: Ni/Fe-hydrogenase, b-type cytochrome subunit [Calditrichia bacterium]
MATPVNTKELDQMYRLESDRVQRYYVWDAVVRVSHWVNVVAVAIMIYTGFKIGGALGPSGTAGTFNMATYRNWHFVFGVVFTVNGLFRAYWFFAGHTYRQWFRFNFWRADYWREVWWKIKDYITLRYEDYESYTLGHNALASLSYSAVFLCALFMALTGFSMWGQLIPGGFLNTLFGWVMPLFGGETHVRMLHRLGMWFIIAFMIHHITFVFYVEVYREKGMLSSMITGLKTRPLGWKPTEKPWVQAKKKSA